MSATYPSVCYNRMIDCHAHYHPPHFNPLLDDIPYDLTIISVSECMTEAQEILELSKKYPFIRPCAGLHPEYISSLDEATIGHELTLFDDFVRTNHKVLVGIGECGLDYSLKIMPKELNQREKTSKKEFQELVFQKHINYSKEFDLALNVHSRNAGHYAIKHLIQSQAKGMLHAFDGKISYALQGVSNDLFFSIPPCIVRSDHFQKLAKEVPLTHLLLESDAPALGPIAGVLNHPRNITISIQEISKLKGIPKDIIQQMTLENSKKVFKFQD